MFGQKYRKKIIFWLRVAGWLCLLPASLCLSLYQFYPKWYVLVYLFVIIADAIYMLVTSTSSRWLSTRRLTWMIVFTIIFISLIDAIPLFFARSNANKLDHWG